MRHFRLKPDWRGLVAYLRDPDADWKPKLLAGAALVYIIWPADLIPDIAPIVGWLDDIGLATVAATYLWHAVSNYRRQ